MLSGQFTDVMLLDVAGTPIIRAEGGERAPNADEMRMIRQALQDETVVMKAHARGQDSAHLDIAIPILPCGAATRPQAVVLERMALERELLWLIETSPGQGLRGSTVLAQMEVSTPAILSAAVGADTSILSSPANEPLIKSWSSGDAHLLLGDDGPLHWGPLTLLTRVPDSDWVLVSSLEPTAARARAWRDVTLSLGWSAAALLAAAVVAQSLVLPMWRADRRGRTTSEEREARLRERLDFLMSGTDAAFLDLGPDLVVRQANPSAHRMYGLPVSDMAGQPLERFVSGDDAFPTGSRLRGLEPGDETTFGATHEHADGTPFPVQCWAQALGGDGGPNYQLLVKPLPDSKGAHSWESYQEKLRRLAADLARTDERERRRLATNLHDRVGQTLTLLRMQLGALESANGDEAAEIAHAARECAERAIQETRHITSEISPPVLYDLGLVPAIDWLGEQFGDRFGLSVSVDHEGSLSPPSRDVRATLFRAVQELLMNVVKHSKAITASVTVRSDEERISIVVRDDGIGFDPESLTEARHARGSFGLFSIKERLELMGGHMEIKSKPGCATIVRLDAPLWTGEGCDAD